MTVRRDNHKLVHVYPGQQRWVHCHIPQLMWLPLTVRRWRGVGTEVLQLLAESERLFLLLHTAAHSHRVPKHTQERKWNLGKRRREVELGERRRERKRGGRAGGLGLCCVDTHTHTLTHLAVTLLLLLYLKSNFKPENLSLGSLARDPWCGLHQMN